MQKEKIFIGSVKPGKFHEAEGQVNLKLFMSGSDVKKIIDYAKTGEATWKTDEGETMVNFQIKTSQSGKMYMEIDQWKPTPQEPTPVAQAVTEASVVNDDDDLPF